MSKTLAAIDAPLTFVVRSNERPRVLMSVDHAEANKPIGEYRSVPVTIADARALPELPTLDREGFEGVCYKTSVSDFYDAQAIEKTYYPEVIGLLKQVTGATEVHIFDHTLRVEDEAKRRAHGTRMPVSIVHADRVPIELAHLEVR